MQKRRLTMKIAILTQSLGNNYGGLFQNYALQTILKRKEFEVCTLDWEWIRSSSTKAYVRMIVDRLLMRNCERTYKLTHDEDVTIHQHVYHFRDTYIMHTDKFKSHGDFVEYEKMVEPDAYIVGSDQCWRPKYNPFQGEMFLNFVSRSDVKRIAYAASFGTDVWEFPNILYAKMASLFDLITVREQSGVKLCHDYLGVEAYHVLDPTLLLDKEDYVRLIEMEKEPESEGDLFFYILDPEPRIVDKIKEFGTEYGMKPFMVLPKYKEEYRTEENVKSNLNDCVYPSPTKWLRGIMDAKMTIVDSFHGMVFSIIFNKPFWVIGNVKRGMSRFTSFLDQFGLEERLVDISSIDKVNLFAPIDWNRVNEIRTQKKQDSLSILFKALENE